MKRAILFMLVIIVLIFSGCSGKKGDYPAAIMVDGTLYYSTGQEMPVEIDDSAVLYTTSYTDKVPKKDGETNFNRDSKMAYAKIDLGVAVLIEHEWVLFEAK